MIVSSSSSLVGSVTNDLTSTAKNPETPLETGITLGNSAATGARNHNTSSLTSTLVINAVGGAEASAAVRRSGSYAGGSTASDSDVGGCSLKDRDTASPDSEEDGSGVFSFGRNSTGAVKTPSSKSVCFHSVTCTPGEKKISSRKCAFQNIGYFVHFRLPTDLMLAF